MSRRCYIDNKVKLSESRAQEIVNNKICKAELRYYYCQVCKHYHITSKPMREQDKPHTIFLHHFKEFLKYMK